MAQWTNGGILRLAYFVWEFPPRLVGGLGTYASEITKKFVEMGHEVEVFTMNDGNKLKTYEENKTVKGGTFIHRPIVADSSGVLPIFVDDELKHWGSGMRFFSDVLSYNILSANKFANLVATQKDFDLLVCHDWLSALSGCIAKTNTKKPLAFHVHSTEYGRSGGRGSPTIKDLEYQTANNADLVVTVSYSMQEELNRLNFPAQKIRVMWNGVDEKKYAIQNYPKEVLDDYRKKIGIAADEKVILFTGRLTWVKGVDTLVRAMPAIVSKNPKAKLIVLGRGEMEGEISALVKQLNLGKNVLLINRWVDEDERILLYASCDVVCAPSRYEPFGIVPLEGMALNKPVVVGVGGMRETVLEGKTGLWCNPDSPDDIAAKLLEIINDDKKARVMGNESRKRVEKVYTWTKIAKDTISLYETIY